VPAGLLGEKIHLDIERRDFHDEAIAFGYKS
jgi:hypothetical protein